MDDIDLGFPEERDKEWLTNRYFPSKVGGTPAWLELEALPSKEDLQCVGCKNPKTFLCQLYAPFDDEHNFHRSIYVFVCRNEACQKANSASNFTVFRSQLPRKNNYYSEDPPAEDGDAQPSIAAKKKLCQACGCSGPLTCSRCKKVSYCSAQHQRAHWPYHKKHCSTAESKESEAFISISDILFPEWEIVIEPSDGAKDNACTIDDEANESKRLAEFQKLEAEGKTGELKDVDDSELDKYAQSCEAADDKHFRKFKNTIEKEPEQIVRYKRNGLPLWIADVAQSLDAIQLQIPNCELCGAARHFEFQIMPQMLLLLKDECLDWGVLAIYTCANSCKPPADVGYLKEYIIKQDIVSDKK